MVACLERFIWFGLFLSWGRYCKSSNYKGDCVMDSRFDIFCAVLGILSLLCLLGSIMWMGWRLFFG